ncbi:MAG: hypothetical protein V7637_2937 [Mycobacteriales bacterium]|jgi:RNA polymerase sigma factor (sigma-70 family)
MGAATTDVETLVSAACAGDEAAWQDLVDRYVPLVRSILMGFRLSAADAEDVSQMVWLRLVEHLDDLRQPRALPSWLATTTRNECYRLVKANQRSTPVDPTTGAVDSVAADESDEGLLARERKQALLAALAELDEAERGLLLLLAADPPLSYQEISRRTGRPPGSIGPTRGRLLRKLRSAPALRGLSMAGDDECAHGGERCDATVG